MEGVLSKIIDFAREAGLEAVRKTPLLTDKETCFEGALTVVGQCVRCSAEDDLYFRGRQRSQSYSLITRSLELFNPRLWQVATEGSGQGF